MNLSYLVSLPEWFNPWGWVGIGVIIAILLAILIVLIVKSFKKGGDEEEEEGEPEYVEEGVVEEPVVDEKAAAPVKTEAKEKQPEPATEPVAEKKAAAPAKAEKTEKVEKTAPAKAEKAEEPAPAPAAEDGAPAADAPKAPKTPVKTYHISKRKDDNKWQVKAAGGSKAIKLFFTQAEAIEFAKKLAESQEARIVIHKEDGSFRRLNYKK